MKTEQEWVGPLGRKEGGRSHWEGCGGDIHMYLLWSWREGWRNDNALLDTIDCWTYCHMYPLCALGFGQPWCG